MLHYKTDQICRQQCPKPNGSPNIHVMYDNYLHTVERLSTCMNTGSMYSICTFMRSSDYVHL